METKLIYTCKNGHKWKSKKWPVSKQFADSEYNKEIVRRTFFGITIGSKVIKNVHKQTRCPICNTDVAMCQTKDGKQGAMHCDFRKKKAKGGVKE